MRLSSKLRLIEEDRQMLICFHLCSTIRKFIVQITNV